jgi:hypothetical protein
MKNEATNRQHFMLAAYIRQCEKQLEYLKLDSTMTDLVYLLTEPKDHWGLTEKDFELIKVLLREAKINLITKS